MKKSTKKTKKISKKAKSEGKGQYSGNGILPLGDRVLVKPVSPEDLMGKTASGIIIPDTVSKEKPEQGKVIAVGVGKWDDGVRVPISVKVGDTVMFSRYGYDEVKYNGEEYYILKEENILAIIR